MILKCYSALKNNKIKTTPFLLVRTVLRCLFRVVLTSPKKLELVSVKPWFGCGFWGSSTTSGTWFKEPLIWWWARKGRKQLDFFVPHSVCRPNNYQHRPWAYVIRKTEIVKINSIISGIPFRAVISEMFFSTEQKRNNYGPKIVIGVLFPDDRSDYVNTFSFGVL